VIGEITNHLWQSTAFAAAAALLAVALRANRAHLRYWIWFAASAKFLVPISLLMTVGAALAASRHVMPIAPSTAPALSFVIEPFTEPPSAETVAASDSAAPMTWIPAVAIALWAFGFAVIVLVRLREWRRLHALVDASRPFEHPTSSVIPIRSSPASVEPGVIGFRRPILLVPEGIEQHLTPMQLEAVLAHEVCHVRRRDNLTSAIHMAVEALFWFHPLVWWIGRRLLAERERACDEYVMQLCGESRTYAEGILEVCKLYVESPLACVPGVTGLVPPRWFGGRGESDLKQRIEDIMSNRIGLGLSLARRVTVFVAATSTIVVPVAAGMVLASARASASGQSQSSPSAERFEVVSIRPCDPKGLPPGARGGGPGPGGFSPGRVTMNCQVVRGFIQAAYVIFANGVRATPGAVFRTPIEGGPDWITSERYTIEAKAAGTPSREVMQGPMLQALLEDRFKLKIHRETREVRVYALTVAKADKLTPFVEGSCVPPVLMIPPAPQPALGPGERRCSRLVKLDGPNRRLDAEGLTLAEFVDTYLTGPMSGLDAHVVDRTGLTGKFDFHVSFGPSANDPVRQSQIERGEDPGDPTAPELPVALQEQLGLKLQPGKGPGEFIVIDHVERPSTDGPPMVVVWPATPASARGSRGSR